MPFNPVEHRICFATPEWVSPSAWIEHVPLAMLLIDLARPRVFVELGTFSGTSYCAFCQAVKELDVECRCYAVDNWTGDEHGGFYGPHILADLQSHHDPRYSSFSQLIQREFDDALSIFADGSIDLLHIDGYHTYEAVAHDFAAWLPKMSRSGIVVFHDIAERKEDFGVWKLWDEIKTQYPRHVEFFHGHGLGIVSVGEEAPEGFLQFVEMPAPQLRAFRELARELGSGVAARVEMAALRENMLEAAKQNEDHVAEAQRAAELRAAEQMGVERTKYENAVAHLEQQRAADAREYEVSLSGVRTRLAESEADLGRTLWQLKWLESSRGVRAVKLARASRAVLAKKGPMSLAKHGTLWMLGRRGYNLSDINGTAAGTGAVASQPNAAFGATAGSVREQHLPESHSTFAGVSIIIPVFNALEDAKNCVESLFRVGSEQPFEVIVIDNGSRLDVLEWLRATSKSHERFWYVSVTENLGFSKAINIGIDHARGDYVVLHNSDTVVTKGWLDHLISALQTHPELGIVSPMTNYVGNGPQIAEDARQLPVEQAERYAASIANHDDIQFVADRLVFFCVALPRRVVTQLGGLSGVYGLGNFEDDDYCVRVLSAGYKLGIVRNSFVFHHGTKTFKANNLDHDGILDKNRVTFVSRTSALSTSPLPALWRDRAKCEPTVSVVLRTKDRLQTLPLSLMSLANQTFEHFEVVVVNDGGEDVSGVLERFESKLQIQYLRHATPRGAAHALNTGLNAARGEWMAYLDDDDIVYPFHLAALHFKLMETGARFSYADHARVLMKLNAQGTPYPYKWLPIPTWEFSRSDLYVQDYLPIHTWMHSRVDALELGGFRPDLDVHEDWDLLLRLAKQQTFVPTRQVSAEYRFYTDAISNSIIQRRERSLELLEVMYRRYPPADSHTTLEESRELVRVNIRDQIVEINGILRMVRGGEITEKDGRYRILAKVTGMRPE